MNVLAWLLVAALAVLIIVIVTVVAVRGRDRPKKSVRIFIQDGPTIEGVLLAMTRHCYVLASPQHVTDNPAEPKIEVAGTVEIPKGRVLYWQVI